MGQVESNLLFDIITEILGQPRKENKTKMQFAFDCPVCSAEKDMPQGDGKGNLEINYSQNVFKCWACGETNNMQGSVIKLLKRYGNRSEEHTSETPVT